MLGDPLRRMLALSGTVHPVSSFLPWALPERQPTVPTPGATTGTVGDFASLAFFRRGRREMW